jgi:hypothetical protein
MLIALTLEKLQLSKLLIALTQGCRSDTRKHQELTFSVIAKIPPGWYFLARKYGNTTPFGPHPVVLPA